MLTHTKDLLTDLYNEEIPYDFYVKTFNHISFTQRHITEDEVLSLINWLITFHEKPDYADKDLNNHHAYFSRTVIQTVLMYIGYQDNKDILTSLPMFMLKVLYYSDSLCPYKISDMSEIINQKIAVSLESYSKRQMYTQLKSLTDKSLISITLYFISVFTRLTDCQGITSKVTIRHLNIIHKITEVANKVIIDRS